jgi:hypothetical protein
MATPQYEGTSPLISDAYITSEIAGEDLTMGQIVERSADNTVKKPASNPSLQRCGICFTSALSGKMISVLWRGYARVKAYGTLAYGDAFGSGPGGTAQKVGPATSSQCNTSAGTALAINQARAIMGWVRQGAVSGGTAFVYVI